VLSPTLLFPKLENVEPEDCLSTESLLIPSLMISKAANTWLDSGKELYADELSQILSVLESSTRVRVEPVPPSLESQEDEVDREDDEISVAPGSQEWVFLDEEKCLKGPD
jgi:hypothetical protein